MTERRVAILGEVRIDEVRDHRGMRESVAGSAVELVRALRGRGLNLHVIAPVGDDVDGERVRTVLRDHGAQLVALPAPAGTPRQRIVRDRDGSERLRRSVIPDFVHTWRSLSLEAEADVVIDLRDRGVAIDEEREVVLRALELLLTRPGEDGSAAPADSAGEDSAAEDSPAAPADRVSLLRAGPFRFGSAPLNPDPSDALSTPEDWYGLDARIARIAT